MNARLVSDATTMSVLLQLGAPPMRNWLSIRSVFVILGSIVDERWSDALDQARRERSGYQTARELDALIGALDEANEEAARTVDARKIAFNVWGNLERTMDLGLGCTAPRCSRCGGCSARGSGACAAPCGPCAICEEQEAVEPACAACEVDGASGSDYGREHTCRDEDGPWTQLAKSMSLPTHLTTDSTNVGTAKACADERLHTATWSPGGGPPLTFAIGPVPSRIIHGRRHTMLPVDDCERLKVAIRLLTVAENSGALFDRIRDLREAASLLFGENFGSGS